MEALLAKIGLKDCLYIGAILVLVGGFAYWLHEHDNKVTAAALAPVEVVAHKAEIQVAVGTAVAQSTENDNGKSYDAAVARPAFPDIGLVCINRGSGALPETAASEPSGADRPAADDSEGRTYDPSGAIDTRTGKGDAQVIYLQGRVHELEAQMEASP